MTVLRVIYRGSYQPEMNFSMSMRGSKNLLKKICLSRNIGSQVVKMVIL